MQGYVLPAPLFLHMDFLGHVYDLGTYPLLDTTRSIYVSWFYNYGVLST